jgi:hypothetical protein
VNPLVGIVAHGLSPCRADRVIAFIIDDAEN